jgi:hypothetical protein
MAPTAGIFMVNSDIKPASIKIITPDPVNMNSLRILVNDTLVHEHDCETGLTDEQLAFLDRMDQDMKRGIKIQGELISEPDTHQRARFVALNLIRSLKQENDAAVSVSCAWLCHRLPDLQEVHVRDHENGLEVELVEGA